MLEDGTDGQQPQESAEAGNEAAEQVSEEVQKIKFGEVEVPLTEAQKAWENYRNDTSWKAKNTQEAQRIARDREQLQKAAALEKYLSENPDKYAKVKAIFEEQVSQPGIPPELNGVMERIKKAEEEVTNRAMEIRFQTEMAELERKNKDMFDADPELRAKIVNCAVENKIPDLGIAFKVVTHDTLLERGIKQGLEKAQAARKKSNELGNAAPGGSPVAKSVREKLKGKNFDSPEMVEALLNHPAMQELGD